MAINKKDEVAPDPAAQTSSDLVITWNGNEPTPSKTQTIVDGAAPTVVETGQAIANLTALCNELRADVASLRTSVL